MPQVLKLCFKTSLGQVLGYEQQLSTMHHQIEDGQKTVENSQLKVID
jgi:hypothetical protein